MKIKFNKFERVAGIFVLAAIVGSIAASVGVAVKRGWFETKIPLQTSFPTADGIHVGTSVEMAGLRAGSVEQVELKSNNEIMVRFEISKRFYERVRKDSVVRISRPFIIGEKVIDITVGSDNQPSLAENDFIKSEESFDIMDLVSGRKLGPYLSTMGKMTENLKFVAEAFLDPARTRAFVKMFDELSPLIKNMNVMSTEVVATLKPMNKKQQLQTAMGNLVTLTNVLNEMLPQLVSAAPQMGKDVQKIAHNMAILTDEMQKVLPMLNDMAPEFPRASRRAIEALDETVVTLKALQKSFILRGSVKDVRDEEAARERKPAATAPTDTKTTPENNNGELAK